MSELITIETTDKWFLVGQDKGADGGFEEIGRFRSYHHAREFFHNHKEQK